MICRFSKLVLFSCFLVAATAIDNEKLKEEIYRAASEDPEWKEAQAAEGKDFSNEDILNNPMYKRLNEMFSEPKENFALEWALDRREEIIEGWREKGEMPNLLKAIEKDPLAYDRYIQKKLGEPEPEEPVVEDVQKAQPKLPDPDDTEGWRNYLKHLVKINPALKEKLEGMDIDEMSAEDIQAMVKTAMSVLAGGQQDEVLKRLMEHKHVFIEKMRKSGMVDDARIAMYEKDESLLEQDMRGALEMMSQQTK